MNDESKKNCAAIIAAGGLGHRFARNLNSELENKSLSQETNNTNSIPDSSSSDPAPKQFLQLKNLPVFAWSLITLARNTNIKTIVLVVPQNSMAFAEQELVKIKEKYALQNSIYVTAGGATRQESVYKGLQILAEKKETTEIVLIHDAARPFLDNSTINTIIDRVINYGPCSVSTAVSDTIKRAKDGVIIETLERSELLAAQTPQAAHFKDLLDAHVKASAAGYTCTDDGALLEWQGHRLFVVEGPKYNLKLTNPLDLIIAEAIADYLKIEHM